jgi:prepilin-type N-terminal cleavage/methylation domain-containing protein
MKKFNRNQKGFSLIELLIVVAIILIIAAIAIPNLLQARVAANEASAVGSLRTINTAQISYYSNYSDVGFSSTLAALGGTNCAPPDSTGACLIDTVLAAGTKSGYSFTVTGVGSAPTGGYLAVGMPIPGSGNRSFCSTEDATIHVDPTGSAIPDEPTCVALQPLQ